MPTPFEAAAGLANACQALPHVVTGGQPGAVHLARLKEAGVRLILDLRDPQEPRPIDEPAEVRRLGMEYINVPVGAADLTDATMERILEVLRGTQDREVYFHCGSGSRVAGALIPFLMLDRRMTEEDAVAQAMRVGLRSAELMEWGLDYARRHDATP
ncbi:MAG: fused DSP-PTPase phosphatase/NAD kinase-like protein [Gemmatimonadales bacterium]